MAYGDKTGQDAGSWKELCRIGNPVEREVITSVLRSEKIPVQERGEALGKIYGLNAGPLAQVTLYVPERMWERAREILKSTINAD